MKRTLLAVTALALSLPALAADTAKPAEPAAAAPAATAAPATPAASGTVARAQFTSAITDREPADSVTSLGNDQTRIYYFTELKGFEGQKVTHRWEHDGKVVHEQAFDVGSPRYRTYSSKTFDPSWTGEWKVSVIDASGATVSATSLSYVKAAPAAPAAAPAQPAAPAGKPQ